MNSRKTNKRSFPGISGGRMLTYLLMAVFFLGELSGALMYLAVSSGSMEGAGNILERFFSNRMGCTFIQTVVNSFSGTFIPVLLCMVLGFGAVFQPAEALIPFIHGLGAGAVLAEMNGRCGFNGFWTSAVMIFPFELVSALAVIIAAREAILMSSAVGKNVFGSGRTEIDVRLYITKFLVLFSAAAVSAAADGAMTYFFAGRWTSLLGV